MRNTHMTNSRRGRGAAGPAVSLGMITPGAAVAVCVCTLVGVLAFCSRPARALEVHAFSKAIAGEAGHALSDPQGVAVEQATGELFVVDSANDRVEVFSSSGAFLRTFGKAGKGNGEFSEPTEVTVDNSGGLTEGDVYVIDRGNQRIEGFNAKGEYLKQITKNEIEADSPKGKEVFKYFVGIGVDLSGNLWLFVEEGFAVMYKVTVGSSSVTPLWVTNNATGPGFAVAANGNLWNANGSGAAHYSPSGEHLEGAGFSESPLAKGLALDPTTEDLYLDRGTVVVHFPAPTSAENVPSDSFGASGAGELHAGAGIAFRGSTGEVYVADSTGNVVDVYAPATEATVSLGPASLVEATSATLSGTVNPEGSAVTSCQFEYGTNKELSSTAPCSPAPGSGSSPVAVSAAVSGLIPNTTYHYRLSAADAAGSNYDGATGSFKTASGAEVALAVTHAGTGAGSVECEVNASGHFETCAADYSQGARLVLRAAAAEGSAFAGWSAGAGSAASCAGAGTCSFTILEPSALTATFNTRPPAPPLIEGATAEVKQDKTGQTCATLRAQITPNGAETTYHFDYGETSSYGQSLPSPALAIGSGEKPVAVANEACGLKLGTTYHYRVVASNEAGETPAPDQTFATLPAALVEASVREVTATTAILDARVDPLGTSTTCQFEYVADSAFLASGWSGATSQACPAALGAGEAKVHASVEVSGLTKGTVYHYRVVAENALGAAPGPDLTFTTQVAGPFALPDGRRWEMVSPPDKHGALLGALNDAESGTHGAVIKAALDGGALTYVSNAPTEPAPAGFDNTVQVFSARGANGWTSHDLTVPHLVATQLSEQGSEYRFFNEDLSRAIVQPFGQFDPAISDGASEATPFMHTNYAGGDPTHPCESACYRPLVTGCPSPAEEAEGHTCPPAVREIANVPPGDRFGRFGTENVGYDSQGLECPPALTCGPKFEGISADTKHVVLGSAAPLTEDGALGLYEWDGQQGGKLTYVSVLPEGGPAPSPTLGLLDESERSAISADGSRVFFGASGSQAHLYMRDLSIGKTVQLDVPAAGCGEVCEAHTQTAAEFQLATSDGSRVWFTDNQGLTADAGGSNSVFDRDIYECRMVEVAPGDPKCELSDLTPRSAAGEPADVQGTVLGGSEDGEWLYFVADGVLENHGVPVPGAVHGSCREQQVSPSALCNLYVRHAGRTSLVAVLSEADAPSFLGGNNAATDFEGLTARVSPNGEWLAFMSARGLTGYESEDSSSAEPGEKMDAQVYLYHASTGALACASCETSGARPLGDAPNTVRSASMEIWEGVGLAADLPGWTPYTLGAALYQSRYLSDTGRLFFNARDALVPDDVNAAWDVYEYEPQGVGGEAGPCAPAAQGGSEAFKPTHGFTVEGRGGEEGAGCVSLISSGESPDESSFLEASQTGGDVFFLTSAKLASADYDSNYDVYDAHECTRAVPCGTEAGGPRQGCTTADACRAAPSQAPEVFGAPASQTFSGPGSAPSPPPVSSPARARTKPLSRAQRLALALKACRKDRVRSKRRRCEALARRRYRGRSRPAAKKASSRNRRGR